MRDRVHMTSRDSGSALSRPYFSAEDGSQKIYILLELELDQTREYSGTVPRSCGALEALNELFLAHLSSKPRRNNRVSNLTGGWVPLPKASWAGRHVGNRCSCYMAARWDPGVPRIIPTCIYKIPLSTSYANSEIYKVFAHLCAQYIS